MLSVKKILAGRGAVEYYLAQTRRGIAAYYLPEPVLDGEGDDEVALTAPGSAWWGGGAAALGLKGAVERAAFEPLYANGVRPDGSRLGTRFRTTEDAAEQRATALATAGHLDDPYDRWHTGHELRRSGPRASVAAWDCTFSPVKSVSLLWAAGDRHLQAQVWAAHLTAVDAGLHFLEEHAGYVRAGRDGVRVLDTTGLVVARMNEWSSRDGGMQLHTHCLVLNRAHTSEDGKWRALDGRALLAAKPGASAIYNRALESELTRRLGVAWRDRPDGMRELVGVDDDLIEVFSSRRRTIDAEVARMAAAYQAEHGSPPSTRTLSAMAQHATVATRRTKHTLDGDDAQARWAATARRHGRRLAALPRQVVGRSDPATHGGDVEVARLVPAVVRRLEAAGRATFSRYDVLRAALDVLPPASRSPEQLRQLGEWLAGEVLTHAALVTVTPPDPLEVPEPLRRRDGGSVYDRPHRQRWTLRATLDREAWLLDVAIEPSGIALDRHTVERAAARQQLGDDQASAVRQLRMDPRRIGLLVGPAGAGKTRTLRAVVDAWRSSGGQVVGLTVSQAAADVLAAEAEAPTVNIARYLHHTRRGGRSPLPAGALVLVDEASMVTTADLVDIVDQVRGVNGRVLLVGDPAQLDAIGVGGAFDLLADRHGAVELTEIRRFTAACEAEASIQLRARDPAALAAYAMRGRIHGGPIGRLEDELFAAWYADALGTDRYGRRQSVLMITATNEQAASLCGRARIALLEAGMVHGGATVQLADNVASVGDHLVTRRNDRRLQTSGDGWVVSGDLWTVTAVHHDGSAAVWRHRDGADVVLPADYLAVHAQLGYATTAHRAQGVTADRAHALVTADTSRQLLYVAATRGRHANHLWVATDTDPHHRLDPQLLPAPEQILAGVMRRRDPDRASAHEAIAEAQRDVGSLARLGAVFEDAVRRATDAWLEATLRRRGLLRPGGSGRDDPEWPSLVARLRGLAIEGADVTGLLDEAIRQRPLDDARSVAGVLHWRLGRLAGPARLDRCPVAGWLPGGDDPHAAIARQAQDLMRRRWEQLRRYYATQTSPPRWASTLGHRPPDRRDGSRWAAALTAVADYRERYELPDHVQMLGERPSDLRPDAQVAFDHACRMVDGWLVRSLDHLDLRALRDLDARQQAIIDARPRFDPVKLEAAHRELEDAERVERTAAPGERDRAAAGRARAARRVAHLERQASAYRLWEQVAEQARGLRRRIAPMIRDRDRHRRHTRQMVRR